MTASRLERVYDQVVAWRREIHAHPELGFEEHKTSELVERELRRAGIATQRVAKTGIVGVLEGATAGKTLALRADMDALPLQERSSEPFASVIPNVMHACGHDAHTAMLLGAAVALASEREQISGNIKFFFQPAEEGPNPGGAKPMIDAGVLENPHVDAAVMIHVLPLLQAGVIGWRSGAMTASSDDFRVTITGRGGHAAAPHLGVDVIPVIAEIVSALQRVTSREIDPLESFVLGIGTIKGGYRANIIADHAQIEGTIRCFNETLRATIPKRIERIVKGISEAHGAHYTVEFASGYPAVVNDARLSSLVADIARSTPDVTEVVELPFPRMGAEDFAYFARAVPGCMLRLGVAAPDDKHPAMLHAPEFRIDERSLRAGVALFRELALRLPATL
jgi:amidohydrolase